MSLATTQTGGRHYKGMGIQPIEFAYANGYDACAFSTLKYVSRHRKKNGGEDLLKAIDFVDFRVELIEKHGECEAASVIPIETYLSSNQIAEDDSDAVILRVHHNWVTTGSGLALRERSLFIKGLINDLRVELYRKGI